LPVVPVQGVGRADGEAGSLLALPALKGSDERIPFFDPYADGGGRVLVNGVGEYLRLGAFDGTGDLA
jgi:hypothetical protein